MTGVHKDALDHVVEDALKSDDGEELPIVNKQEGGTLTLILVYILRQVNHQLGYVIFLIEEVVVILVLWVKQVVYYHMTLVLTNSQPVLSAESNISVHSVLVVL